ncbi:hypothetical protein NUW54_g5270 [Trametes sanguinea]|uniref:Uncharacterized protein n=1 Tax=Trametes sanguinea TaxID=158606 RepID=A0ACC1PWL4_9APHY|nr:hypothetical protein NUW54_g5270 [Trametes sanguinea]
MSIEFDFDFQLPSAWAPLSENINPPEVSTITAHDVFSTRRDVQTADDIRRDIGLLTIANLEVSKSRNCSAKSAVKNLSSNMRMKSATLDHISTLLTIGLPTTVNAVTGRIEPDGVTIVCASSERRETGQAGTIIRKVAVDPLEGKRLLDDWESLPDLPMDTSFETHVAQVGSILAYAWGLAPSERFTPSVRAHILINLNYFITGRARHRILARVKYAHKLWGSSPFRVMCTWYESNLHAVHPLIVKFHHVGGTFASMLAAKNIHPEPDQPKHYMLSSSNILAWMDILEDVLNNIIEAFEKADAPPSRIQMVEAALAILNLVHILNSDLSVVLQKHDVHTALQRARPSFLWIHGRRKANEESAAHSDHGAQQPAGSGKVDPDDYASFQIEAEENPVQYLFRFLGTIVAWEKAVLSLLNIKATVSQLNVFNVTHAPCGVVTLNHAREFLHRYESVLRERLTYGGDGYWKVIANRLDAVAKTLHLPSRDEQSTDPCEPLMDQCAVHPESVLMVLARMCNKGSTAMDTLESDVRIDTLFPLDGNVIIGASTECCWCCDTLRTSLEAYDPGNGQVSFVLPGTHGIISPWSPPQGVPESILLQLRQELFHTLHRQTCGDHPDFLGDGSLLFRTTASSRL